MTTDSVYPTLDTVKIEKTEVFTLSFLNPCFDTDFVEIVAPTLLNYDYIVFSTALSKTHPAFTVNFSPDVHALCGLLSYSATFDNGAVTTTSKPFAYFDNQLKIEL